MNNKKAKYKSGVTRLIFVAISIIFELIFWYVLFAKLNRYASWINILSRIFALILVLHLYSQNKTSSLKIPWIMLILVFPVLGLLLYIMIGFNVTTRKMKRRYEEVNSKIRPLLKDDEKELEKIKQLDESVAGVCKYLKNKAAFPIYNDSTIKYYSCAKDGLEDQLKELKKAKNFIFMEYHAIENASSWQRIEEVLLDRVNAGVEVRVFYDDMGSIWFVNTDFAKYLRNKGIKCSVFNPFRFGINIFMNNRDHRKITVIDGKVGFTGGYNLADEYFNITHPYGEWKDTGVKIVGPAVDNLTACFLEMWNAVNKNDNNDIEKYFGIARKRKEEAYVVPYADNPMDGLHVGEDVYINIISKSNKYCWFMTPYLILSDEMVSALTSAAKRGVDVRIITPGVPDKKVVYKVTRSFYPPLVKNDIKIYEWTPGFCHGKMCVVDDVMAVVGTINLDYRSLYHHFENACFFAYCDEIKKLKEDFEETFKQCDEVSDRYKGEKGILSISQMILRLFAGLL